MSLPTLREILALPAFQGAELLLGQSKLDEPVTWVHVSEVMDAARFLSGGELLLSTGLELARAEPAARMAFVRSLVEAGAQGLALELVQWMQESGADNVGGLCITRPDGQSARSRAIAIGMSHPLGVGNSYFRIGLSEPRWVERML